MRLLLLLCGLLVGCKSTEQTVTEISEISPGTVLYQGETSRQNVEMFESVLVNSKNKIDTLVINSEGGDVMAGLHLGGLVHEYQLKVIVRELCASSCANYVITASPDVRVEEQGIIGWHGGALQPLYVPMEKNTQITNYIAKWQEAEKQFFETINVEQAITIIGMMPGITEKRDAPIYSYDVNTLKRLGLHIQFEGEQTGLSTKGEKVVQIFELEEAVLSHFLMLNRIVSAELIN
ncbi:MULTISPECIES: hypothetical protein [Pseudoalteromonas]|jgi:hypothetical protein|uniref:Uncharacterized protein n=1 Tax=Pseudoalteromonas lipolytica TaxID=570156 RepID=A0ABY1G8I0_9GAMM|nr:MULTISPECIES: hypothetical protein [Pseudoalteromonas]MBE0352567.1 hypothetical protein [Pseudoalteromonas lipolytica LMEB 39]QLJ10346.1 hypothetical protein GZH31_16665 [Pseudoalteromonas sp. JSTW]SFT37621.1 hypothetical protein SAMN04487854_10215 [Pseudoalteromonas lipolytica]